VPLLRFRQGRVEVDLTVRTLIAALLNQLRHGPGGR
jgi:hypothetical protein